jgi:hypothetical protein
MPLAAHATPRKFSHETPAVDARGAARRFAVDKSTFSEQDSRLSEAANIFGRARRIQSWRATTPGNHLRIL